MEKAKVTLTISITYDCLGTTPEEIKHQLDFAASHLVSNGMLTGDLSAEVDDWEAQVDIKKIK